MYDQWSTKIAGQIRLVISWDEDLVFESLDMWY